MGAFRPSPHTRSTGEGGVVDAGVLTRSGTGREALVVAYDRAISSAVGGWLEMAGFDVDLCPGPRRPDYRCIAADERDCPLARDADVIVLDLWLQSDADDRGSSAMDLVRYYRSRGKPLLILDHGRTTSTLFTGQHVAVLSWPPKRDEVERFAVAFARDGLPSTEPPTDQTFFGETRPRMT